MSRSIGLTFFGFVPLYFRFFLGFFRLLFLRNTVFFYDDLP